MSDFFKYWNELKQPETFLADDKENPSRGAVAEIVKAEISAGAKSMVEVGPGSGHDYGRFYRFFPIEYTLMEGSQNLCQHLLQTYPTAKVRNGTFDSLVSDEADIIYCRHVLEHQKCFREPLRRAIAAARMLCIVTWYRPPSETEVSFYHQGEEVHYNTYRRSDVMNEIASAGCKVEVIASGTNEIYLIRKA